MKEIKAIIQPFMAQQVLEALHQVQGVSGVMASEVKCTSAARGVHQPDVNVRIELYVPDDLVDEVLNTIAKNAHTGKAGDGRVFIADVERTLTIRNGEQDFS